MSCSSEARELVTFWVAGSLARAEAEAVSRHVAGCAECRAAAIEGAALIAGLRELHLRPDEVVSAAAGEFDSPHLLVCPNCREEVALLRAVNADLGSASSQGARGIARAARRWMPLALAAVAASLVLFAFWLVPRRSVGDDPALRGGTRAVVELQPATAHAGVPVFSWTPLPGATRYRIAVFFDDGRTVWTRETATPPVRWPDDVPRSAGRYKWRVEALAGSATVASSPLADVEIPR